jgi:hypothetical protein
LAKQVSIPAEPGADTGMVKIYDIMNITCQNLSHMPYQSSTYITPQAGVPSGDIGFSGSS